jgi:hypothetical protein
MHFEVLFDGTVNRPWGRQLCADEHPTKRIVSEPSKRTKTIATREFQQAIHALDHVQPQALNFDSGDAA